VSNVDKEGNTFVVHQRWHAASVSYDANAPVSVNNVSVGLAAFEAALSTVHVTGLVHARCRRGEQLPLTTPRLGPGHGDPTVGTGASSNDVTVTVGWAVRRPDSVLIERAAVAGGPWSLLHGGAAHHGRQSPRRGLPVRRQRRAGGTYRYRASIVIDGDAGPTTTSADRVVTAPRRTSPPRRHRRAPGHNAGSPLFPEDGDTFDIVFSEVIAEPTANATGDRC
jgi:hypothetical protein